MDELEKAAKERQRQQIADGLKPLFEKARREKLLFRSSCQGIILTPDELEKAQAVGRFVWGPVNWELVDPGVVKTALKKSVDEAQQEYQSFLDRLQAAGY